MLSPTLDIAFVSNLEKNPGDCVFKSTAILEEILEEITVTAELKIVTGASLARLQDA